MQSTDCGNESGHPAGIGENAEGHQDHSLSSPAMSGQNRKCTKCEFQFSTKGLGKGNFKVCPTCRETGLALATTSSQTSAKQQKRSSEEIVSPSTQQGSAKKIHSLPPRELTACEVFENALFSIDEKELYDLNKNELIERVISIAKNAKRYQGQLHQSQSHLKAVKQQLKEQQQLLAEAKIAFADKIIASHSEIKTGNIKSYASVTKGLTENHKHSQTTVALKINTPSADKVFNLNLMDKLLNSKTSGNPIPLKVTRKDDKGFITFQNQQDANKALSIIKTSEECKAVFNDPKTQEKLFPAIGLFAPIGDMADLKDEISFRNSFMGDTLVKVIQIHKCKEDDLGHIKLFFSSAATRDEALLRSKIHTSYKLIKIVPIDPNREVRRCYKCNRYGHTSSRCTGLTPTCGKCACNHDSRSCTVSTFKCPNCAMNHMAGDASCPEQIKAVKRFCQLFNL